MKPCKMDVMDTTYDPVYLRGFTRATCSIANRTWSTLGICTASRSSCLWAAGTRHNRYGGNPMCRLGTLRKPGAHIFNGGNIKSRRTALKDSALIDDSTAIQSKHGQRTHDKVFTTAISTHTNYRPWHHIAVELPKKWAWLPSFENFCVDQHSNIRFQFAT
jgi:hypothetical protein